jgi:hypothetical protein
VRYPVSKTGGPSGLGGSTPSPSASLRCGRAARRATVNREAQVRILPPEPPRRSARFTGETSFPRAPPSGCCSRGRACHCSRRAGSAPRRGAGVRVPHVRAGHGLGGHGLGSDPCSLDMYLLDLLPVGEQGTSPASGAGDRWFDSSQADCAVEEMAVLASLMSSRPRVRIPPALFASLRLRM